MKKVEAAASLALLAALAGPLPASAQGRVDALGGASRSVPAPGLRYERGNFPVPGLPVAPIGFNRRDPFRFGYGRPDRPHRPDRPDRPDRQDRVDRLERTRDRDHRSEDYGYGYYGYGIGYSGVIDQDRGYFASGAESWRGRDGSVSYDYDRGYPYDYYRPRDERATADRGGPRESSCDVQWVRGGRSGERVPVRVCRN